MTKQFLIAAAIPFLMAGVSSCSAAKPDPDALTTQAYQAMKAGKYDEAIDKSQQAIKLDSKNMDAHWYLAQSYLATHQDQKAIDLGNEMLKQEAVLDDPEQEQNVLFVIGQGYMNLGDLKNAEKNFQEAREVDATPSAELMGAFGECLLKEKNYGYAITTLTQACGTNPRMARLFWLRGKAYGAKGDVEPAIKDFETASALEPGNEEIVSDMAGLYGKQKQYRPALYVLTLFNAANPKGNLQTLHDRIWQKAFEEASADKQSRPNAPVPYAYLAMLYMDKGDATNAREMVKQAFDRHGDEVPLAWRIKGDLAALDGKYQEAIEDYDKAFAAFKPKKQPTRDLGGEVTALHKKQAQEKLGAK